MPDSAPYCDYQMTVRVEIPNQPGQFARIATALAEEGANLGAIDIVEVRRGRMVRDITFDTASEAHAERVLQRLKAIPELHVRSASDRLFLLHLGGKIHTRPKVPVRTRNTLAMAYTPGVARVSRAIAADKNKVFAFTSKANTVMEGKAMLFKEFADIDSWPLCLATQNTDAIIQTVMSIAPSFGGINLEDISAPRCFDVEDRLKQALDIPVMHDDQHGTAVVLLAALHNALKVVGKSLEKIRVVINGLGAAGTACGRILLAAGVQNLVGCDRNGAVLNATGENLDRVKKDLRAAIDFAHPFSTLQDVMIGADVFIGVSAANLLKPSDLEAMAADRIVFAMANPEPEIAPELAMPLCRILATGRSDFPNQVNNLLGKSMSR